MIPDSPVFVALVARKREDFIYGYILELERLDERTIHRPIDSSMEIPVSREVYDGVEAGDCRIFHLVLGARIAVEK